MGSERARASAAMAASSGGDRVPRETATTGAVGLKSGACSTSGDCPREDIFNDSPSTADLYAESLTTQRSRRMARGSSSSTSDAPVTPAGSSPKEEKLVLSVR